MSVRMRVSQMKTVMGIVHGSRAFGGPFQAAIWLTDRCNVRCIHCYFFSPYIVKPNLFEVRRARMEGIPSPDGTFLNLLEKGDAHRERTHALIGELLKMGTQEFLFTGSGEPFLHKNALEFMDRVKRSGRTCIANTNGTLLDRAVFDELVEMEFDELRITTMAGTREMYLRTHQGARGETFDVMRENLLYLAERKAALGKRKPKVNLVYIVLSQNFDGLFDFAEFASIVGAERVSFQPVDDIEDPGLSNLVPTEEEANSVREQLTGVKAYLEARKINHNIDFFFEVFRKQIDTMALYNTIPCYMGWLSTQIQMDGEVYPCCRCYEPLGNVNEKTFQEIWNGQAYRKFRKDALLISRRKTPVRGCDCNSCVHYTANFRVHRMLHPIKGLSRRIDWFTPDLEKEGKNL